MNVKDFAKRFAPPIILDLVRSLRYKSKKLGYQKRAAYNLLDYVDIESKKLLVVGLGRGIEIPFFLSKGCSRIDAIDPFPIVEADDFGLKLGLINSCAENIPVKDDSYDVVYTIATLEHIRDPHSAVKEMLRVLKPNGIFYCSAGPFWYSPYGYHAKKHFPALYDPWFHIKYSKEEYIRKRKDISDDKKHLERIEAIYESSGYNRLSSDVYYEIASELMKEHIPLHVSFGIKSEELLAKHFDKRLEDYAVKDLLTSSFFIVFRKIVA